MYEDNKTLWRYVDFDPKKKITCEIWSRRVDSGGYFT
jgi:hypothetical protein